MNLKKEDCPKMSTGDFHLCSVKNYLLNEKTHLQEPMDVESCVKQESSTNCQNDQATDWLKLKGHAVLLIDQQGKV
jgi:hypothetical protein